MSVAPSLSGDPAAPRPSLRALRPLLPYAWRYRGQAALAVLALTVASAATLTVPLAVRRMVDLGFTSEGAGLVNSYFGAMAGVVAVLALASGARYYLVMTIGERVVADLRTDLFGHMARLDATFHDGARTGDLVSRLTADTTQMKSAFGASASVALRNLFLFAGAVVMMVLTSPKLSGLVLVAIPIIVLPLVASGRSVRARARAAQDRLADATAFAAENLAAVRTMQAFGAEARTVSRFGVAVEAAYRAVRDATAARAALTSVGIFLAFGSVVAVLWLGARDVLAGRLTGGVLSQFLLYAVFGAGALGELSQVWSEISAASGAASRIADILATRPRIAAPDTPTAFPIAPIGTVAFENVSFAYPARPGIAALDSLSFVVAPGERVALVGPSGAGKSTIFALLMRFYDPDRGRILVDGVDIRTVDPAALRQRLALVPQDPVIFGTSVTENIAYGGEATSAAIAEAARRAAADGFVAALPGAYEAPLGERGITLSGGQKQRLAIARAILRDAPILLLDEATSALDAESETLVQAALHEIMRDRTTLVIAHRLATVLEADRILVIEGGRIVEQGSHATLAAAGGLYARLARLQFGVAASGALAAE